MKKKIAILLTALMLTAPCTSVFAGTWEKDSWGDWKYKQDNGTYIKKAGWELIDGDWYYFSGDHIKTNYEVYEYEASGAPRCDLPTYFVGTDGKMVKSGFSKVYDGGSLIFSDSTGKVIKGFFMVDNVLYYVSTDVNVVPTIMPNRRKEKRDKFQCADGKERTLHYIYDGGKVLELDGNPIKSDDKFYQLIKYIPKYNSQGVLVGEIRN